MENKEYRVAVYLRVASKCDFAIENQKTAMQRFVAEKGYINVEFYSDNGYNGLNFNRPAFIQMDNDIKAGLIDVVVIKDISRISRNNLQFGEWLDDMHSKKVKVISVNDNFDSENYNPINLSFLEAIKKYYKENHSQRIKYGIALSRQRKLEQTAKNQGNLS